MKLSTNFVKDYVDIDVDIKTLAEEDSANRIADIVINIANNKK